MKISETNLAQETRFAKLLYGDLPKPLLRALKEFIQRHEISLTSGDVKYLNEGWYVTHSGLLRLAERRHCAGIIPVRSWPPVIPHPLAGVPSGGFQDEGM